mgnify:CR=1 FL=1
MSKLLRLLGVLVGAGAGTMVAAALGSALAHPGNRLDLINHAAPFLIVGGIVLCAAVLFFLPANRMRLVYVVATAIATVPFIGRVLPESVAAAQLERVDADPAIPQIRIIWLNAFSFNADTSQAVAYLRDSGADIIAVSERIGDDTAFFDPLATAYPHRIDCNVGPYCAVTIMAKAPLEPVTPPARLRDLAAQQPEEGWFRLRYAAVVAAVPTVHGAMPLTLLAVHMQRPSLPAAFAANLHQLSVLSETLPSSTAIVVGDFNATPWSNALQDVDRVVGLPRLTRALATWPVRPATRLQIPMPVPLLPIDHAFAGRDWRVISVRAGPRVGSDHLPVELTLQWAGPLPQAPPPQGP